MFLLGLCHMHQRHAEVFNNIRCLEKSLEHVYAMELGYRSPVSTSEAKAAPSLPDTLVHMSPPQKPGEMNLICSQFHCLDASWRISTITQHCSSTAFKTQLPLLVGLPVFEDLVP